MSSLFSSFGGILFVFLEEDLELVLLLPIFIAHFFVGEAGRVSGAVYTEWKEECSTGRVYTCCATRPILYGGSMNLHLVSYLPSPPAQPRPGF